MLVLLPHLKLQNLEPQCVISAQSLGVENMNGKRVLNIDSDVLCQKVWSLYEDFRKGFPEKSDTKPLVARKGCLHTFMDRFGLKMYINYLRGCICK